MKTNPALSEALLRYAYRRFNGLIKIAGCYARHGVERRLASCLSATAVLLGSGSIRLAHHQLAAVLGVTRPSMTLALNRLEAREAISTKRNLVEIRSYEQLRAISCGCYGEDTHVNGTHAEEGSGQFALGAHRVPPAAGSIAARLSIDAPQPRAFDGGEKPGRGA